MSTSARISLDEYHAIIARGDFLPREELRPLLFPNVALRVSRLFE